MGAGLRYKLDKVGEWAKFDAVRAGMKASVKKAERISASRLGYKAYQVVIQHINMQDLSFPELQKDTLRKKEGSGFFIDKGDYKAAIDMKVKKGEVWVGIPTGSENARGESLGKIAGVLEFGSTKRNIPPRPLWAISQKEVMEWHIKENLPEKILYDLLNKL